VSGQGVDDVLKALLGVIDSARADETQEAAEPEGEWHP